MRSHVEEHWSLDKIAPTYSVTDKTSDEVSNVPTSGVFIGLILEGACYEDDALEEAKPKELFFEMPVIHNDVCTKLEKRSKANKAFGPFGPFNCPVYRQSNRTHLNYITTMELNPGKHKPGHFIRRGVALLLSKE